MIWIENLSTEQINALKTVLQESRFAGLTSKEKAAILNAKPSVPGPSVEVPRREIKRLMFVRGVWPKVISRLQSDPAFADISLLFSDPDFQAIDTTSPFFVSILDRFLQAGDIAQDDKDAAMALSQTTIPGKSEIQLLWGINEDISPELIEKVEAE